jgi:myo-inositol-1(or 4)-monophosphatase
METRNWEPSTILPLLLEAGAIALAYFHKASVDIKADQSLVTEADLAVEQLIRDRLECPELGIFVVGEESINERSPDYMNKAIAGCTYVVDPIDGTVNYANGLEMWGVSIGYMESGILKHGAIYMPVYGELFVTDNDKVLFYKVKDGVLSEPEVMTKPKYKIPAKGIVSVTQKVAKRGKFDGVSSVHAVGVAVYPILNVMRGRYIAYIGKLKLWDVAGGLPMLERLGLEMTMMNGDAVGMAVTPELYRLDPNEDRRFALRDEIVFCHPGDFAGLKEAIYGKQ